MASTISDSLPFDHKFYGSMESKSKKSNVYAFHDDDEDGDDGDVVEEHDEKVIKDKQNQKSARIPYEYAKSFQHLLQSIGFMNLEENIYKQLRSLFQSANLDYDDLTLEELNLINIFKCDAFHDQCYFTSNDELSFRQHLEEKHPGQLFFCFYCIKSDHHGSCSDASNSFSGSSNLIDHINQEHLQRLKYQCNLCFYRAFTFDHILIHQAFEHSKNFQETIKQLILEKKDDRQLNVFEKSFLQQINSECKTSDDETEIEENADDDVADKILHTSNLCKIIRVCSFSDNANVQESINDYLDRYSYQLEYQDLLGYENFSLHCAYCNASHAHFNGNDNLWIHFITSHPEHPIIAYDMSSEQNQSNKRLKNGSVLEVVNEFKKLLELNSLPRIYEEKLMNDAFNWYHEKSKIEIQYRKGIKRKREIQKMIASSSEKSENDQIDSSETFSSINKRRRLFGRFIPESLWAQTKTIVGMASTIVVALGFYHFTQYLPAAIQQLVENN